MPHPDDEIVTTMTRREWDALRTILADQHYAARRMKRKEAIYRLINNICHNANVLSLEWLDKKREEFP